MKANGPAAGPNVEKMIDIRDQKAVEVSDLEKRLFTARAELVGYDKMLAAGGLVRGAKPGRKKPGRKPKVVEAKKPTITKKGNVRKPKVMVKGLVMEIVSAAGNEGITLHDVVAETETRGRSLPIDAVNRFLQRFKSDGHLVSENGRYKIP